MGEVLNIKATARPIHYAALLSIPVIWGSYGPLLQRFILTTSLPIPFYNFFSFLTCSFFLHQISKRTESISYPPSAQYHDTIMRGGMELGVWLFLGATCLAYGLQTTSASKAAIILSMKSVNVSILECISAKRWPDRVNIATCMMAVYGVRLVTSPSGVNSISSSSTGIASTSEPVDMGCMFVMAASCFYSIHIFRLGAYSKSLGNTPLSLATIKGLVMATLTFLLVCVQWLFIPTLGMQYNTFMKSVVSGLMSSVLQGEGGGATSLSVFSIFPINVWVVLICIIWNGGASIGYSMWAQVFAQKCISSTAASFVYASTPIWAIFWSYVLLVDGVGAMSWTNWLGGGLLMTGVLVQLVHCSRVGTDSRAPSK